MVNYACAFSQSELGIYFEWIIIFLRAFLLRFFGDKMYLILFIEQLSPQKRKKSINQSIILFMKIPI